MTETIADPLVEESQAKGGGGRDRGAHSCMTIRGIRKPGSVCVTSAMPAASSARTCPSRSEIMNLIDATVSIQAQEIRESCFYCFGPRQGPTSRPRNFANRLWPHSIHPPLVDGRRDDAVVPPRDVTSGYYRNNLCRLLGSNALAALAVGSAETRRIRRRGSMPASSWHRPWRSGAARVFKPSST